MTDLYLRVGSTLTTSIDYANPSPVTGKVQGDFVIELSRNGVGNQSTTGITITEVDATNNAGEYNVSVDGVTGFMANTGTYTLTIYDNADDTARWDITYYVTVNGTPSDGTGPAYFASSSGDGRITDGAIPLEGAQILFRDPFDQSIITQTVSGADGNWEINIDRTATGFVQLSGYTQESFTLTVTGGVATGPGSDVALTAITAGTGLTGSALIGYTRRQCRDVSGNLADQIIKEIINESLLHLAKRHRWQFLQRVAELKLDGDYTEGQATILQGSAVLTITGGIFPGWAEEGEVYLASKWYRVASRDSDTQLTLEIAYEEPDIVDGSYRLYRDAYVLPVDLYQFGDLFYGQNWIWGDNPISFIELLRYKNDTRLTNNYAYNWSMANGKLYVWPPPTQTTTVNFNYYAKPGEIVDANSEADWDPLQIDVLHRAIDFFVAQRYGQTAGGQDVKTTEAILVQAINTTLANDMKYLTRPSPMRRGRARGRDLEGLPDK